MTERPTIAMIEQELRASRPTPRGMLLEHLVQEVRFTPAEPGRSPWHGRLGIAMAIVALVGFGLAGGLAATASGLRHAGTRIGDVLHDRHGSTTVAPDVAGGVVVCVDGIRTRHVAAADVAKLVASGHATYGACPLP